LDPVSEVQRIELELLCLCSAIILTLATNQISVLVSALGSLAVARVIRHLIDDRNIGVEVTHYLEDVEDHLLRTVEELSSFASECASLKDEYNAYLDRRMNDILYVLTLVTTLIVPGQFFTGYYGMLSYEANASVSLCSK
jgi:Mg2+ and Co2+ transporter CorA